MKISTSGIALKAAFIMLKVSHYFNSCPRAILLEDTSKKFELINSQFQSCRFSNVSNGRPNHYYAGSSVWIGKFELKFNLNMYKAS